MKNLLRIGMLLCSFLLASVGWAMAEEDGGGTTGITTLEALKNAILSAQEGAEITLADDITGANAEEGSAITIDKALTLDGANHTISGTAAQNIIVITKAGVILKNVTIINTAAVAPVAGTGYNDVTVFQTGIDTETTLEDVTLQGNGGIGLVVNGSKVKIKNVANGMAMEYTIVADSEANLKEKKIASSTPIAQGLLGHKLGDIVEIRVPSGLMKFEIVEISF